jgi:hypothetical protein
MSNGVVVCSYGRLSGDPTMGVQVMFTLDGGETWLQPTQVYHAASTGYTCMLEVRPGELLLCYDQLGTSASRRSSIMSVRLTVDRAQ